jgi:hypothetical protein
MVSPVMRFTLSCALSPAGTSDSRVKLSAGSHSQGTERLLRDCALVGRVLGAERAPARWRLEEKLGEPLARQIVAGLRRRPTDNGR